MEEKVTKYIIHGDICSHPTLEEDVLELVNQVNNFVVVAKDENKQLFVLKALNNCQFTASKLVIKEDGSVINEPTSDIYYQYEKLVYDKEEERFPFDEMDSLEAYGMPFFGK